MNLPNKLTMLRIILTPVFLAVLYWGFPGADYAALAIFIIASVTDMLDGKIARKYNLVTDFGKFADPLADKILVVAAMLWFVECGRMPAWMLMIVITREFAVSGLRMIASDNGRVIAAGWSGKVKTAATMVCIAVMLLMGPPLAAYQDPSAPLTALPIDVYVSRIDTACVWVITLTTLYSGVEYFAKNKDVIRSA
ncbi:MAG: CDP-diacylglycerol--glycerol-3-phosphate 3-phosphatidyltransferase [Oscillibacter sp.]|nr:CDP-diacylglycerol--glycerol-3-phosphate 3-phosphatidyltransferase [Oscillibacter sp.]